MNNELYDIDEVAEETSLDNHIRMKERHRKRRKSRVYRNDRLLKIINTKKYAPHIGYIDYGFDGDTLLHSGKYIKYPKNSNVRKDIKRSTSKRIRRYGLTTKKGNQYRRLLDYWWTLY
ncbi:MAG: hypothetical protein IJ593_09395 [Lachnospiraceae bacterium]|nr:hypothetical protein [Lachnospiraceae bacterium]